MFSKVKVGESLYCLLYGEGKVTYVCKETSYLKIKFSASEEWYRFDGTLFAKVNRTLYRSKPTIIEDKDSQL